VDVRAFVVTRKHPILPKLVAALIHSCASKGQKADSHCAQPRSTSLNCPARLLLTRSGVHVSIEFCLSKRNGISQLAYCYRTS
jgi:hypothetical protein